MATMMRLHKNQITESLESSSHDRASVTPKTVKLKPIVGKRFTFSDLLGGDDLVQELGLNTIKQVRLGIESGVIGRLAEAGLEPKYRQRIIPERTFQRRQKAGERLTPEESERALRYARVVAEADRVFGEHDKGMRWLHSPMKQLENQSPLDVLDTDIGARLVEEILGQIDEGFFA
ncbi:MAG: hypothetical protein B7Y40_05695 [Gammaproteobacteria bacterium 28-57-27]|nr:MAG: hypothetical protein B7Y40_05695 [Gammaproteobacteria bacterium 28-57-27]